MKKRIQKMRPSTANNRPTLAIFPVKPRDSDVFAKERLTIEEANGINTVKRKKESQQFANEKIPQTKAPMACPLPRLLLVTSYWPEI